MTYLIGLYALLVIHFIYVEIKGKPLYAFFSKGLASFGFMTVFALSLMGQTSPHLVIALLFGLGLIAGLLGDLYLALRPLRPDSENIPIINSGIACFSVGHIFYVVALLMLAPLGAIAILIALFMTALVVIGSKVLKFDMKGAQYPSYLYSLLIFFMVGQALHYSLLTGFNTHGMLLLVGALLFGISDLILAPIYFKKDTRSFMIASNLVTYYAAQVLIALSVFYLV